MPDTARLTIPLGDRYLIERELGAGGMGHVGDDFSQTDVEVCQW